MNIFTKHPRLKKIMFFSGGRGVERGARLSRDFFTKDPNLKKKYFFKGGARL